MTSPMRWHTDNRDCPTCDFDRYYVNTYPDCPWRDDEALLGMSEHRIGGEAS